MNANEARKLSEHNIKGPATDHLVKIVLDKIDLAAMNGEFEITEPFTGLRMPWPTSEQLEATWVRLQVLGYKVMHHPDPDPGHPCSHPYTSISW